MNKMKKFKKRTRSMGIAFLIAFWLWPALGLAMDNGECLDCHNDEGLTREQGRGSLFVDAAQFHDSAHHGQGIMCIDCHADIAELNYDNDVPHAKNLAPVACSSCHEEEQDAFANSVHTQISSKGITMTCYACHDYHYATPLAAASVAQRDNNFCAKCHNPYQSHDWLPKKEEHFAFVECTVCHVPEVQRHIHLKFFDLVTNQFYKGEDILAILGIGSDQFMPMIDTDNDGTISRAEFEVLELMLRQKNVHAIFHAELVAEMAPVAHQVKRGVAERNCEKCHTAESPYFEAVSIVLTKEDGGVDHHQVDRAVLKSYSLSHFYLYAGTRVKLLDMIGILLIGGAGCGVLGHLAIRIVTIRGRRQKKEKS
ncbi:MAG: cytochrome c3 family protein [Deltaproteobacteria bacterium]|jgi:predicted CXXCH cytochrome family protein|nr:cytochrome c3 family protein [Deltaproteobacteria bacterium]